MSAEDIYIRRHIAISIIENCKHLSHELTPCEHCVDSARIVLDEKL